MDCKGRQICSLNVFFGNLSEIFFNLGFDNLGYGIYCVWYNNLTDGNDAILIPGGPTFPQRGDTGFSQTIPLADGENKQVDFGYAWQFFN